MKRTSCKRMLQSATLLLAGSTALPAAANDGPYVGIEGGYNIERDQTLDGNGPSTDVDFDGGPMGGLVLGHAFWFGLRPELALDYRRNEIERLTSGGVTTSNVSGREDLYSALFNVWYDIKTPRGLFSVVHPYLGAGIGWGRLSLRGPEINDVEGRSSWDSALAWQFGAGVGVDVNEILTVTADYRHVRTREQTLDFGGRADGRYRADSAMLGLRFAYGLKKSEPAVVSRPVRTSPPPPPDRCAKDTDGDGVSDCEDTCANTPRGFKVDRAGCIVEQSVILRGVNFVFNKDQLTVPARETLDEVAAALAGQPALSVQIKGHTDSVGSDSYNRALSQRRADSVRRYLVSKGVRDSSLQATGAGESQPIASNDTEEGRAQNRRVEFVVLNDPPNVDVKAGEPTSRSKQAAQAGEPQRVKDNNKKNP
jgi:OmpA-OmpF porin, OOP family